MAKLKAKLKLAKTRNKREVQYLTVGGIVSAPTVNRFRKVMEKPLAAGRDILLDLRGVSYMNSSGLGELLRLHDALQKQNLALMVVAMKPEVLRLTQMLGLASVLYIFPNAKAALAGLDAGIEKTMSQLPRASRVKPKIRQGGFVPVVSPPPPRLPEARILLALDGDQHFQNFLIRCLSGHGGQTTVVHCREEARAALGRGSFDLAILESALPDAQNICEDLKLAPTGQILSVIAIYPDDKPKPDSVFRVREDEFVIEPFEMREMVALAEGEYERCQSESILFTQEASFEVANREEGLARAGEVIETMLGASGLAEEAANGFFYALREAMDNARRHGNQSAPEKTIDILYIRDKEKITVTVGDEGRGFDYDKYIKKARASTPIEQARTRHTKGGYGGLGIGLMLRCCDKFEYLPPGNVIKLTKYL